MKKFLILFATLLLVGNISQSCKKKNADDGLSDEEVSLIVKSDLLSEDVIEDITGFVDGMGISPRPEDGVDVSNDVQYSRIPSCVTVSHYVSGDTLYVDFLFDASGCQMPNGHVYAGTVHVQKYRNHQSHEFYIHVEFDNFYVDQVHVEGEFTRTRTWTNANGNPEATVEFDMDFTWPNGDTASREGTRTREWIEGYDTRSRADDVFLITGNWHAVTRDGDDYQINILTPLRREMSCRWIVSGTMEIIHNGDRYELDFGNGTCDDEATLTLPNGQTRTIYLR
jgi:hypothetical protein